MNLESPSVTDGRSRDLAVDPHPVDGHLPTADRSKMLLHRRLEEWARTRPDAIALEFGDERLTYAEFNQTGKHAGALSKRQGSQGWPSLCRVVSWIAGRT